MHRTESRLTRLERLHPPLNFAESMTDAELDAAIARADAEVRAMSAPDQILWLRDFLKLATDRGLSRFCVAPYAARLAALEAA